MSLTVAWRALRARFIAYLKAEFIQLAFKKLLRTAVGGRFKVWLVKYLVTEFYEEIGLPIIHYIFNEAEYQADVVKGKLIVTKLDEARSKGNEDSYDSAADNVFN